jgi:hypothetical protein
MPGSDTWAVRFTLDDNGELIDEWSERPGTWFRHGYGVEMHLYGTVLFIRRDPWDLWTVTVDDRGPADDDVISSDTFRGSYYQVHTGGSVTRVSRADDSVVRQLK